MDKYILLRHRDVPQIDQLEVYRAHDGFVAFEKALNTMKPADVMAEVKASGLRGRGGAGFPTGIKWGFLPSNSWPHYVVANADESEPGTFKDREIMESNPFQFLEGLMLASFAVQANCAYVYLRGEFWQVAELLNEKIKDLETAGLLGEKILGSEYSLHIYTHLGAGAYICGEETALLESLEGKMGQPRLRPPFPAVEGLYGKPTLVNNVETLTNVPPIIQHGADWYRGFGTEQSPGVKIFSLSGCVKNPGNYELPLGVTYQDLVYKYGGGIAGDRKIKAVMSAGASSDVVIADEHTMTTPLAYETCSERLNAPLGSASVIVLDESVDMAWLVDKTINFFKHESCGKCTPCREGTYWMNNLTRRIVKNEAEFSDIDLLRNVAIQMQGKCLCALGEFATIAVVTAVDRFHADFEQHVRS
ncbi:MAG: NADH-quinone oxidoreductase subunit NuoF [Chloroflexi bacterium HGW-Chloroflexi-10]|nr:MAG: NADH-quinone oxidoreductase subunit NuoF [Chloroflexi bacterium HGW-Chloroflexi-10]